MKTFIKQFIPPVVSSIGKQLTDRTPSTKYNTYEEALAHCQKNAYGNSDLVKVVVDKNLRFKSDLQKKTSFDLHTLRTLISIGLAKNNNSLNVIDFGGGGGYHHTIAEKAFGSGFNLKWNVVETTAMANEAKRMSSGGLKFFDDIKSAQADLGAVDLVFTSCALQYCPNPIETLKQLINVNAKYLFITRTPFNDENENYITIQTSRLSDNGPGVLPEGYSDRDLTYPITYANKKTVVSLLEESYTIRFEIEEDESAFKIGRRKIDIFGYFCVLK